ncbi:2,3-bisphosphoglycerate-dependent phosphoglycerate mutase [Candidatus Pacearchaeota archaeon]|nr:2,3-bisphosphoglycerate-dependent phosphoglycerate mutase [Candidatus Pacearchaeota archaeon]
MAKYNIYVFRHGQTYFNKKGIFTGWKESRLTPLGIKQARIVARKLKNKKIEVAFQSKLSRSKDTLKEVLKFHPECRKIITDDRIIERDYGNLDGVSHEDFIKRIGNQEYDLLRHGDSISNLPSEARKKVEKFLGEEEYKLIHRGYDTAPPNGESFKNVEKRVSEFIKFLKFYIKKNRVNVAISAHGNSIRLFRKIMEKKSREDVVKWNIPYDTYFHYVVDV